MLTNMNNVIHFINDIRSVTASLNKYINIAIEKLKNILSHNVDDSIDIFISKHTQT